MPITDIGLHYEKKMISRASLKYSDLVWCELGNQSYKGKPAKLMYQKIGVQHTSIDINGLYGSIKLDLDFPVPIKLEDKFDVITNYGTTEHVNNQYSVFKNIHIMCKYGGLIIHAVPLINNWPKHCRYYYSQVFFKQLSNICKYTIMDIGLFNTGLYKKKKNMVVCTLRKNTNKNFISLKVFSTIKGLKDSKNKRKTGNYAY